MPKYSLVVPTLNRAHLLEGVLESLSRLNHDSYEVIVSSNLSSDGTDAVATRWVQTDRRFRYVQTSQRLAMSDHWDFALGHVEGDYFIYCGDDDSFDRNILKALDQYIAGDGAEGVYWRQSTYYYPSWFQKPRAGNFYIPQFSGRKWTISAEEMLQKIFALQPPRTFPIGTSFCFRTSTVRSIVDECGVFFARPYPDYTSTMMYLPSITKYLYVDVALSIIGKSADSNAAAVMYGPKKRLQQFVDEHNGELYPHVPLNYHVIFNGIAECVCSVQSLRPKELGKYKVDWVQYFRGIYDAVRIETELLESKNGRYEYWKQLLKFSPKEQVKILNYVLRVKAYMLRQKVKHIFDNDRRSQPVEMDDTHGNDVCMALSSLTECSHELSEHNRELGFL